MKKTSSINLNDTIFTIEEDAYEALKQYLDAIRAHFDDDAAGDEIIKDVEARIAEKFSESNRQVITLADVTAVQQSMGQPEEFGESSHTAQSSSTSTSTTARRLYRDPDTAIIAGVASGLAAFFNIDPIIVRLVFVIVAIFGGGTGILVYILIWLLVPEAKNSAQKLEMRGNAVTLENVRNVVREKVHEVQGRRTRWSGVLSDVARLIVRIVGLFIAFVAAVTLIAGMFAFVNLLFNSHSRLLDVPFAAFAGTGMYYATIIPGFFAFALPALLIFMLGVSMFARKFRGVTTRVILAIIGFWIISLIATSVFGVRLAERYASYAAALPQNQSITQVIPVPHFSQISTSDTIDVQVIQGTTTNVTVRGLAGDIDSIQAHVTNNTLKISHKDFNHFFECFFCNHDPLRIEITVPELTGVSASDMSSISSDELTADTFTINSADMSQVTLNLKANQVVTHLQDMSHVRLTGTTKTFEATLQDFSNLAASTFLSIDANITTQDMSKAEVDVRGKLIKNEQDMSGVVNTEATDATTTNPE